MNSSPELTSTQINELANNTKVLLDQVQTNLKALKAAGFDVTGKFDPGTCALKINLTRTLEQKVQL